MTTDSQLGFKISRQQRQHLAVAKASQHVPYYQSIIQITGTIDADQVHQALQKLVQTYEIFHTGFKTDNRLGEPLQNIEPDSVRLGWSVVAELSSDYVPEFAKSYEAFQSAPLFDVVFANLDDSSATLLMSLSALIADHQTMSLLLSKLANSLSDVEPEEELVQYVDFAEWQDEVVEEDEPAKTFWSKQDLDHLEYPRLPQLAVKENRDNFQFSLDFSLPCPSGQDYTMAWMLSVWMTALHRFSGAEHATCLVHSDGRVSDDFQQALGAYSRLLPLSLYIRTETTGSQLQDHIQMQLARLESNQMSLPLLEGKTVVKGVGFELLSPLPNVQANGLSFVLNDEFAVNDGTDIKLSCRMEEKGVQARILFNQAVYHPDFIEVLIQSIQTISANWQPELPVKQQIIVTRARHMAAMHQAPCFSPDKNTVTLIEEVAADNPHLTAVEWDGGELNYGELNKQANQLAHSLIAQGIGPGKSVGLCFERSSRYSICMLAVLKTGGAFISLDSRSPPQRLQTILQDADMLLIAQELNRKGVLDEWKGDVVAIDSGFRDYQAQLDTNPSVDIEPQSVAYLLFTSGSTGKPKGVQVTHQGLTNYLHHAASTYLQRSAGAIVHTSIGFDLTITGMLAPLTVGKKVFMVQDSMGMEVLTNSIMSQPEKMMLKLTPAHLKALNPWLRGLQEALPLDVLVVGGEALYGKDISVCRERFPELKIYNEYGPTEATVGCSIYLCDEVNADEDPIPIGHPISATDLYILDEYGQALPRFCSGELYIGGAGLAAGYKNLPDITAERFVELTLPESGPQRLYKTGDVVRLEDTQKAGLIYLGRNDNQIKIRGYRIELGEIEAVLKSRMQVKDVAVTTRINKFSEPEIVAYLETEELVTVEAVQEQIAGILPVYMHPAHVVCIEGFPLTRNGKVDIAALPDVDTQTEIVKEPYVAPSNEVEQHLVDAYQAALAIDQVGIKDHFFALGGDSIRAVHVVSIANEHDYDLKVEELFNNPTVEALSQLVANKQASKVAEEANLMSAMLDELEGLSDEEVAERLAEFEEEQPK